MGLVQNLCKVYSVVKKNMNFRFSVSVSCCLQLKTFSLLPLSSKTKSVLSYKTKPLAQLHKLRGFVVKAFLP